MRRDDPAFRSFFPEPATSHRDATRLAGHLFDKRVDGGTIWTAEGGAVAALHGAPPGAPVLLLAHQPKQVSAAVEHGVDLQLSGTPTAGRSGGSTCSCASTNPCCRA